MKGLMIFVSLCLFMIACDSIVGPSGSANTPKPRKPKVTELTLENATDLKPGRYRLTPNIFWGSGGDARDNWTVDYLHWGTVTYDGKLTNIGGFGKDARKVFVRIDIK